MLFFCGDWCVADKATKKQKKSDSNAAAAEHEDHFMIKPDSTPATTDASSWPLLLKVFFIPLTYTIIQFPLKKDEIFGREYHEIKRILLWLGSHRKKKIIF